MNWLIKNVEWLFSGIGVTILSLIFMRRRSGKVIQQSVKKSSNVTQIGGDVKVGEPNGRAKS